MGTEEATHGLRFKVDVLRRRADPPVSVLPAPPIQTACSGLVFHELLFNKFLSTRQAPFTSGFEL